MRWAGTPDPKQGDRRERLAFAWLPMPMEDDSWVWLERYFVREEYEWDAAFRCWSWLTRERRSIR